MNFDFDGAFQASTEQARTRAAADGERRRQSAELRAQFHAEVARAESFLAAHGVPKEPFWDETPRVVQGGGPRRPPRVGPGETAVYGKPPFELFQRHTWFVGRRHDGYDISRGSMVGSVALVDGQMCEFHPTGMRHPSAYVPVVGHVITRRSTQVGGSLPLLGEDLSGGLVITDSAGGTREAFDALRRGVLTAAAAHAR